MSKFYSQLSYVSTGPAFTDQLIQSIDTGIMTVIFSCLSMKVRHIEERFELKLQVSTDRKSVV
jgi:hypothetical protein